MKFENLINAINEKATGRNVYFFWSGGDDSNLLLRFILNAEVYLKCALTVITIPFPQHAYSREKLQSCVNYFATKKINLQILDTSCQIPNDIPYADACPMCKAIRRTRFLDFYAPLQMDGDLIITGHNLSDLMSYYIELCIFQMDKQQFNAKRNRFLEVTNKFLASYTAEKGIEIFRPMLNVSQVEIRGMLENSACKFPLDIMSKKCFWADQRKRLLQEYFVKSSVVSDYDAVRALQIERFGLPTIDEFRELSFDTYLV